MADTTARGYVFAACPNPTCCFRFPAAADDPRRERCPRCGRATELTSALDPVPETWPPLPQDRAPFVALLDNIRSTHNAGSMFRTADGAGLGHLHLCGITATPEHPKLAKAALGTQATVPWSYHPNGIEAASTLRAQGYTLVALERLVGKAPMPMEPLEGPLALIVGNERAGIDPAILAICDRVLSLPMIGRKSSLNAAVAFGIAVYALRFDIGLAAASMSIFHG